MLKKAVGGLPKSSTELPPIDDDSVLELEPDSIVDTRWLKRGGSIIEQSLICWKKLPLEDAMWEDTALIHQRFPTLTLEDKGSLRGEGDDKELHKLRKSKRASKPNSKYKEYAWAHASSHASHA